MNTLTPPSRGESSPIIDPIIRAELFPGTELTLATEQERVAQWQKTGEATGPKHIGMLDLNPDVLEAIKREATFDFCSLDYDYFSDDEERASDAAALEKIPLMSVDARKVLGDLLSTFIDITEQDRSRSDLGDEYTRAPTYMYIGMYKYSELDPHIDLGFGGYVPRYIATIAGPSTLFFTGKTDPRKFSEEQVSDPVESIDYPTISSGTNVIDRFAADCDPHSTPIVDEPVFRITIISQFHPKRPYYDV